MVQASQGILSGRPQHALRMPVDLQPDGLRPSFEEALGGAQTRQLRDHMQELLDRILNLSDGLSTSLNRQSLDDYREAVRQFLGQVIERSVQIKRDIRNGNLLSVKTVNSALERLGNLVVEREQDRLKILDEIGEIKGLLVSIRV